MKKIFNRIKEVFFGKDLKNEKSSQQELTSQPKIKQTENDIEMQRILKIDEDNKLRQELTDKFFEQYWNQAKDTDTYGDYLKYMAKNVGSLWSDRPREEKTYNTRKEEEIIKKLSKNNKSKNQDTVLRIKSLKDISTCFYMMTSAYGEDKETEKIYKISVEYLKETKKDKLCSIDFIELANYKGDLVVAIFGSWDDRQGLKLPWDKLPRSDSWTNPGGFDNYKTDYLMNSEVLKSSTI